MTTMLLEQSEVAEQLNDVTRSMTTTINELTNATVDAVIDTRGLSLTVADPVLTGEVSDPNDRIVMTALTNNGAVRMRMLEGAHDQLAEKLGIPKKFYDRLVATQPDLIATLGTELMQREPKRRMIRMLRAMTPSDHTRLAALEAQFSVRAVVSDSFRALDHGGLLEVVMPEALLHGQIVSEWTLTERKFYVRFKGAERTLQDVRAEFKGATGGSCNETLAFGSVIQNSETGHAALSVSPWARILRCLNGMVVNAPYRVSHVGKRQDEDLSFAASDTKRLETATQFAQVRDRFVESISESAILKISNAITEASEDQIVLPDSIPMLEFVSNVGKRFELSDREREILAEEVVHEQIESRVPVLTRFSVSQGMTALARRTGDGEMKLSGGAERRLELENFGWKIVSEPSAKLIAAAKAASSN